MWRPEPSACSPHDTAGICERQHRSVIPSLLREARRSDYGSNSNRVAGGFQMANRRRKSLQSGKQATPRKAASRQSLADDQDHAIYFWVFTKVTRGEFFDDKTGEIQVGNVDLGNELFFSEVLSRSFYHALAGAIIAAWPQTRGNREQRDKDRRQQEVVRNLVGDAAQAGMRERDDTEPLMRMFEQSHEGVPLELFRSEEAWMKLSVPKDINRAALARKVLTSVKPGRSQSDEATVRRLAKKFTHRYPYLVARYIFADRIEEAVVDLLRDVAALMRARRVAIRTF